MTSYSYCIWNNKGGVGKTTLTYQLATRLAETEDRVVLVMDVCPQANLSQTLIGEEAFNKLRSTAGVRVEVTGSEYPRTISGRDGIM